MRYVFGDYLLDTQRREFSLAGEAVPLRPKVFQVLAYLLAHRDRVVRKQELLDHLWPGQYVADTALNSYIMAVRKAIGDQWPTPQLLRTVRGYGYRFVAPVRVQEPVSPAVGLPSGPFPKEPTLAPAHPNHPLPAGTSAAADATGPNTPAPDGEYKPVTVLCCTAAEVLTRATRSDPEVRYRLMQAAFGIAHEVISHYGGTITSYAADAFTAVFGAPVAQEDHAWRAVMAALDLSQRRHQHPIPPTLTPATDLPVRIGLHSGLALVGRLGHGPQEFYTAMGEPTTLATRLQHKAAPGTILVSAETYQLVRGEVRVELWGTLDGDEWATAVPVYTVRGLSRLPVDRLTPRPRVWSPFVGRARELALLHDRLDRAHGGHGQVVALVGDPGMGKSRLLAEFHRRLPASPITWYIGHCRSYGQAIPYRPLLDVLRQLCGIAEGESTDAVTAAIRRGLQESGRVGEEEIALLGQFLDLPGASEPLTRLSPELRQSRTFALLRHLVLQAAQRQPLVLVVENLHWIDATSDAWLASLVECLAGAALLLVVTARPEYRPTWGAHSAVTQLALPPLGARDSRTIVRAVRQAAPLPDALIEQLVAAAAGNPFFLEELVWHAREQGSPHTPGTAPETVHAVLAARIDCLPREDKHLLECAAVVGTEVPLPLLQAIAELSSEALLLGLARLQAAEFLYETRRIPDMMYTFKHALTQQVAYETLLQERRRALHARIVEALEALAAERLAEQVERLADHALRGEVWDKAVTYCRQSGEKAMAQSAHREAERSFEQALRALSHLPQQRHTREQAIDLRLALRNALFPSGNHGRILTYLREAEALAAALDDPRRLAQVSVFLSNHLFAIGAYDQAIVSGKRALALAKAGGDLVQHALTNRYLGVVYKAQGDFRRAIHCFGQAVVFFEGTRRHERFGQLLLPSVFSRAALADCHAEMGAFAEGRALGEEGLQIAEAVAHPASLMFAVWGIGTLALCQGDLPRAAPLLERAVALCQDADLSGYFPRMAAALGSAYTLAGRVADAVPLLTQALAQSTAMGRAPFELLCRLSLGQAQERIGRLDEALIHAERALALACAHQERGHQAYALHLRAGIEARHEPPARDRAEAHYREALALAKELGMRPLVAHCHLGLGTLYASSGRPAEARMALSAAITSYRAMEMTWWLPQAEVALAQVKR
jgi:class 3 adenylate cyclase/DNA-binding winged helix-turn-helix (wHTH) protein/tetratricopeptide (TPR) repeat protein